MKINFDHQIFTMQPYGGISRYYKILAQNFSKFNNDIYIFCGIYQNNYLIDLPSGIVKGFKIKKNLPKTTLLLLYVNRIFSEIKMFFSKPDIIHETYYSSFKRYGSKPIRITTAYDMIHEEFPNHFSSNDKTVKFKSRTFNEVDHIICISKNTKKDLIKYYHVDENKISVIYLGIDINFFNKPRFRIPILKLPYLLYVGRRDSYKNFNRFLEACSSSGIIKNNYKLVAFGGGKFTENELLIIKKFKFSDGCVIQMNGDDETLASLYSFASCFIYPSLYEGFGLSPLEAMASGCPVAASNTSSIPEVIGDAGVLFNPSDFNSIRTSIESVLNKPLLSKKLVKLGHKRVEFFSWEKCAEETLMLYKKLLNERKK